MAFQIQTETVPIRMNTDGVALVGETRVTLETVLAAFNRGATPEEIVMQYPALSLSDVYLVIGYYLQHRDDVDDYIRAQQAQSEQVRREIESRSDFSDIRERMLARRAQSGRNAE
jgi:uncharacterized protein (DUF433 family)